METSYIYNQQNDHAEDNKIIIYFPTSLKLPAHEGVRLVGVASTKEPTMTTPNPIDCRSKTTCSSSAHIYHSIWVVGQAIHVQLMAKMRKGGGWLASEGRKQTNGAATLGS